MDTEVTDLSFKSNKFGDKRRDVEYRKTEFTMDLSVKRRRAEPLSTTDGTLDLTFPSSNTSNVGQVNSLSGVNRRAQSQSQPRQFRGVVDTSRSNSPILANDDDSLPQTNGHVKNGDIEMEDEMLPMPPSPKLKELTKEELKEKETKLRHLKEELRNEEMKLVLLKKIRQSQIMKENTNIVGNINLHSNSVPVVQPPQSKLSNSLPHHRAPIPYGTPPGAHRSSEKRSHHVLNPPVAAHSRHQNLHGPIGPPSLGLGSHRSNSNSSLIAHHAHQSTHQPHHRSGGLNSIGRTPVTTPPNVVLGYPVQDLRAQSNSGIGMNAHPQNNQLSSKSASNGSPHSNTEITQTPAQRQATAKLALRKQLEKTLLQIPPPKPPPPEMHFIPNANNQEFVYYLGLETVVDFLTDSPNQNRPPPEPFECVQCGTDFTCVWKWQDRIDPNRDRPAVICESCVTSNIKKALKAEHTNRLKTAFVKALQQEQEIEQRIASGTMSPPLPSISPPPTQPTQSHVTQASSTTNTSSMASSTNLLPQAPPAHSSMPRLGASGASAAAAAAAAVANSAALLQQMPKLSAAHQSLFAAQAQQLHQLAQSLPQSLTQPQPAHMLHNLPFAPLLAAQTYYNSMLGKSGVSASDLHRQYLLDMIPPRSLPQGSVNWKT